MQMKVLILKRRGSRGRETKEKKKIINFTMPASDRCWMQVKVKHSSKTKYTHVCYARVI